MQQQGAPGNEPAHLAGRLSNPVTRRRLLVYTGRLAAMSALLSATGIALSACGGGDGAGARSDEPSGTNSKTPTDTTADAGGTPEPTEIEPSDLTPTAQSDAQPREGGTLTILRAADALNLTPGASTALPDIATNFLLYDALVIKGFDGKMYPALAKKWRVSDDGRIWTFKLRKDVQFHSGEPFTAAHVVDHFNRWRKRPTSAKIAQLDSVETPDDYTVVCTLFAPTPTFLNNVSQTEWAYASIPNMKKVTELVDRYGLDAASVDGTGPYKLEEWVKGDHMTLARNEEYNCGAPIYDNRGRPYPEKVILRAVPSDPARSDLLTAGEAAINIDVSPRDVARLDSAANVQLTSFSRLSSSHIGFNMKRSLFQDINVRKAIMFAINREQIVASVMQGQADLAEGYLHPEVPGANPREKTRPLVAFDPTRSRTLLDDAGWKPGADGIRAREGRRLSFTLYLTGELNEQINRMAQVHLREVGIDMQIKRLEPAAFDTATRAGEHDARYIPMVYTSADHLYFFTTGAIPSPNTTFWSDATFDGLYQASQTAPSEEERATLFQQMEIYLLEQAVVIPIQHLRWLIAWQERVRGTKLHNIHGIYKLMDTWIE